MSNPTSPALRPLSRSLRTREPHDPLTGAARSATGGRYLLASQHLVAMDTIVSIHAVYPATLAQATVERRLTHALDRFVQVEALCTRFDRHSELAQVCTRVGEPISVSPVLFAALRIALAVARRSGGAFDPTVGSAQLRRGVGCNYRTEAPLPLPVGLLATPSHTLVRLDLRHQTVRLRAPLLLDLGGVAKGLAMDLAAHELEGLPGYLIEAGGDLLLSGCTPEGSPWRVGVRDPVDPTRLIEHLALRRGAVCSSSGSARRLPESGQHHIVDPRRGRSPRRALGATVLAPSAALADALATAALVLGPHAGLHLLRRCGADGMIVTPTGRRRATPGFARHRV